MDEDGGHGISERELTCAICTEILYQPLALLDCLHTFCGACLKEWFKWQAASAVQNRRNTNNPYTCPSCREPVRRTKADWRLNTPLNGFLKAHPDKAKSEQERIELSSHYKLGEDVLPPVQQAAADGGCDDERLLADVMALSMTDAERRAARQRRERNAQNRVGSEQHGRSHHHHPHLTESRLREHEASQPQIEHQPSLRSLLSTSDTDAQDVQADILRSIYTEGLLDGIDLDNLTTEQEEELTERIADAYRRRQRHRDRSHDRDRQQPERRSTRPAAMSDDRHNLQSAQREVSAGTAGQSRSRPPVSRPHLFEQTLQQPPRNERRSRSSNSHRGATSDAGPAPASRSATDLSQRPSTADAQRERSSRQSGGRSVTAPVNVAQRQQDDRETPNARNEVEGNAVAPPIISHSRSVESPPQSAGSPESTSPPNLQAQHTVRPVISNAAFAPEPVVDGANAQIAPSVQCNRCERSGIQYDLHYNCRSCAGGTFNLCLDCYREGRGCDHWFGFGFRAYERWFRNAPEEGRRIGYDQPHILTARRYTQSSGQSSDGDLQEGAFCDSCLAFANDCYWYCNICLEGAWGFCDTCVKQGKHCTHPLLVLAHINTLQGGYCDPSKLAFVGLPHLRQDTYVNLPLSSGCDVCNRPIPENSTRLHCDQCNGGDYDVCNDCYRTLVSQGKISQANGPNGWRRCLEGHRMAVVGFQDTSEGGHLRTIVREPVGGWTLKENGESLSSRSAPSRPPPDGGTGMKCLALYNYFPKGGVSDELAFPKNAEIREVEAKNGDWYVGVYAGKVNLFPSNHVRVL